MVFGPLSPDAGPSLSSLLQASQPPGPQVEATQGAGNNAKEGAGCLEREVQRQLLRPTLPSALQGATGLAAQELTMLLLALAKM